VPVGLIEILERKLIQTLCYLYRKFWAYAAHILNNIHEYGIINKNMSLFKQLNKGPHINSEQFDIQLYGHNKKLVPEQTPGEFNPIYLFVYNLQSRHITV
jgi:hypothetical protein